MTRATRPLLVTTDERLLDDLLRLCAAAGVEVDVVADAVAARRSWVTPPLVIVGADAAPHVAALGPRRREGVVLVGTDLDDASVWQRAVDLGAEHVAFLPDAESWLLERLADVTVAGKACPGRIVCVTGGRGGAGASTLATALALTGMRRGLRTILVDGDPLGCGIDLVLGGEDATGVRWPDLRDASGTVSAATLHDVLPSVDELTVLSWDRSDVLTVPAAAMEAVLGAARRANDLVVVDLPRRVDEASAVALARCDVTLIVVPAEVRAAAAAALVASAVASVAGDVRVVVRGPAPAALPADVLASSLGLPLSGSMRAEPGLAEALERGEPPARRGRGPLAKFCARFLDDLALEAGVAA